MRYLGQVIRIQIQVDRLKRGEDPHRVYDPAGIRAVDRVWVRAEGLVAPAAEGFVVDVHHQAHPHTRNRGGENGISLGFTSHYEVMRARFGDRMALGVAGENLIVDRTDPVSAEELEGGVVIRLGGGGELRLGSLIPAPPCAPFAQWAMGSPEGGVSPQARKEALIALGAGIRGFYARVEGAEPTLVTTGDEVWALG